MADAIVLEGVGFSYPGSPPILRDLRMRVGVGEVVALVGPTGCGKSTLLHICSGIIPHYQAGDLTGSVNVLGLNTTEVTLGAIAAQAGVVTQDPENQLFNLFVADEVAWGMENRGMGLDEMHASLGSALRFFKIPHLRDRITYDLSGGEKQRVVLAATYAPGPGLFLLDGPTSQLDPLGSEEVLAGIRDLAAEGHTILLVEEKLEELWSLVDRVLLLDHGAIQLDIGREELHDHVHTLEASGIPLPPLVELGALLNEKGLRIPPLPALADDAARVLRGAIPRVDTRDREVPAQAARDASSRGQDLSGVPRQERLNPRTPVASGVRRQERLNPRTPVASGVRRPEASDRPEPPESLSGRLNPRTPVRRQERLDPRTPVRLKAAALSFTYPPPRRTEALREVDLELPAGAIVAVVGHNGSGKTTLARCISGELRLAAGLVEIDGRDVHRMSVRERAGVVGYVFQNPDHQVFKDPVIEDVAFGPLNLGASRAVAMEVSERVLKSLNLWDKRDLHPFRLSKGDRQRLAIAGVAAMAPPVIIIDEPTTGQDLLESNAIMALLAEMAREANQTVVVITHAMELVAAYSDLVIALKDGEVLAFGPPQIVFRDEEKLRRTFVKPPSVTALGNRLGLEPRPLTLGEAVEAMVAAAAQEVARE